MIGFFQGNNGSDIFYEIMGEGSSCWIICSPILEENIYGNDFIRNYQRFLAANSISSLRIHYEGEGNSSGVLTNVDINTWIGNTLDAINYFDRKNNYEKIYLLGIRFGSVIASRIADEIQVHGIAHWSPVVNGNTYFDELLNFNIVNQFSTFKKVICNKNCLLEKLKSGECINILGYELNRRIADSIINSNLSQAGKAIKKVIIFFNEKDEKQFERTKYPGYQLYLNKIVPFWKETKFYQSSNNDLYKLTADIQTS